MVICLDSITQQGCGARHHQRVRFCPQCGQNLVHALQVQDIGAQIGAYQVIDLIGHGGFGVVYLAEDMQHQPMRRVALKETFDAQSIRGLRDEFDVLRQLRHMHLPAYYEVFEQQGYGYLAMEYVPGQSLADVLRQQAGPLPESQVLGYAIQICDALLYLHGQKLPIIHRDIKPANIRITPAGLIKLVDFGLLKQGGGVTRDSRRAVTPGYAPLEQYGGRGGTDARSDIYSLGATLYHLLTGVEPEDALDRVSSTADPLLAPRARNGLISVHVSAAVMAALAPLAKDRPREVSHFKQALLEMSSIPVGGGSTPQAGSRQLSPKLPGSRPNLPPTTPTTPNPATKEAFRPPVDFLSADEQKQLLRQAIELVQRQQRASASLLQRRLHIGYSKAEQLIDLLEQQGIVGPPENGRSREVLRPGGGSTPQVGSRQLSPKLPGSRPNLPPTTPTTPNPATKEAFRPPVDFLSADEQEQLLRQAIELVQYQQRASASLLQRRLHIGYSKAEQLIDLLEQQGIVGPPENGRSREVLRRNQKE